MRSRALRDGLTVCFLCHCALIIVETDDCFGVDVYQLGFCREVVKDDGFLIFIKLYGVWRFCSVHHLIRPPVVFNEIGKGDVISIFCTVLVLELLAQFLYNPIKFLLGGSLLLLWRGRCSGREIGHIKCDFLLKEGAIIPGTDISDEIIGDNAAIFLADFGIYFRHDNTLLRMQ